MTPESIRNVANWTGFQKCIPILERRRTRTRSFQNRNEARRSWQAVGWTEHMEKLASTKSSPIASGPGGNSSGNREEAGSGDDREGERHSNSHLLSGQCGVFLLDEVRQKHQHRANAGVAQQIFVDDRPNRIRTQNRRESLQPLSGQKAG